jgi:hypothetical protein
MLEFIDSVGPIFAKCETWKTLLDTFKNDHKQLAIAEDAEVGEELRCALNLDSQWQSTRQTLVASVKSKDKVFGAVLEFVESLTMEQRRHLLRMKDAVVSLTSGDAKQSLSFLLKFGPRHAEHYSEIQTLCHEIDGCDDLVSA